jgi:hypothetical protein
MHESQLSPSARNAFKLIEFDEDERLVYEIRKHWFGLFLIYFIGTFITFSLLGTSLAAAAFLKDNPSEGVAFGQLRPAVIALTIILSLLSLVMTAIAAFLYKSNVILVTSEKIAQVLYVSIFDRKLSQLSIGDLQDVTVRKQGIFAHLLNFGTLVVETAGEQSNFAFAFAPEPYKAAEAMVNAHEENLKHYGN